MNRAARELQSAGHSEVAAVAGDALALRTAIRWANGENSAAVELQRECVHSVGRPA